MTDLGVLESGGGPLALSGGPRGSGAPRASQLQGERPVNIGRRRVSYCPTIKSPSSLWGGVRVVNRVSFVNCRRLDIGIVPMVTRMRANGILIDRPWFEELRGKLIDGGEMGGIRIPGKTELHMQMEEAAGMSIANPGSDPQVARLLFDQLGLPTEGISKTKGGDRYSTADEYLERLLPFHPVVAIIQDWREHHKLERSYAVPIPRWADSDDRLRADLKLTSVETGRLSCANPNLMAIPTRTKLGKLVRRGFIPRPGCRLISVDESQIEMRIAAHYSSDPVMCGVFHNNGDIHSETASRMFGLPIAQLDDMMHRYPAKRVGFGVMFGITAEGLLDQMLAARAVGWTLARCQEMLDLWFGIYSGIKDWMEVQFQRARRFGLVWDMFGRPRFIPETHSASRHVIEAGLRQSGNSPIQAGAQGTMKLSMAEMHYVMGLWRDAGWICEPLMQIHDEVLLEVEDEIADEVADQCKVIIANCVPIRVPIKASAKVSDRWAA